MNFLTSPGWCFGAHFGTILAAPGWFFGDHFGDFLALPGWFLATILVMFWHHPGEFSAPYFDNVWWPFWWFFGEHFWHFPDPIFEGAQTIFWWKLIENKTVLHRVVQKVVRIVLSMRWLSILRAFQSASMHFKTFFILSMFHGKELFLKAGRSRPVALKKSSFQRNFFRLARAMVSWPQPQIELARNKNKRLRAACGKWCAPLARTTHFSIKKTRNNSDPDGIALFMIFEPNLYHFWNRFWTIFGPFFLFFCR